VQQQITILLFRKCQLVAALADEKTDIACQEQLSMYSICTWWLCCWKIFSAMGACYGSSVNDFKNIYQMLVLIFLKCAAKNLVEPQLWVGKC